MFYITAIRLGGGSGHEHITHAMWLNGDNGVSGSSTLSALINFIEEGNKIKVGGQKGPAEVRVVRPQYGAAYLRTVADGQWSDNLLALPRF